jgi:hypothetical protein
LVFKQQVKEENMEKERTPSEKIDEMYGNEREQLQEEEEPKSLAQQMISAIKSRKQKMFTQSKGVA